MTETKTKRMMSLIAMTKAWVRQFFLFSFISARYFVLQKQIFSHSFWARIFFKKPSLWLESRINFLGKKLLWFFNLKWVSVLFVLSCIFLLFFIVIILSFVFFFINNFVLYTYNLSNVDGFFCGRPINLRFSFLVCRRWFRDV